MYYDFLLILYTLETVLNYWNILHEKWMSGNCSIMIPMEKVLYKYTI